MSASITTTATVPTTLYTPAELKARHPELPMEVAYDLRNLLEDAHRMGWAVNEDEEAARLLHNSTLPDWD